MTNAKTQRSLVVGDLFPRVILLDGEGGEIDFSDQLIAGQPLVLFVQPDGETDGRQLEAALEGFMAADAHLFLVSRSGTPAEVAQAQDPDARLAALVGFKEPGFLVVDARGRVAGLINGSDPAEALKLVQDLHEASAPERSTGNAPILIVPNVLDRGLCEDLIAYWESGKKVRDALASAQGGQSAGDPRLQAKRRADVVIEHKELFMRVRDQLEVRLVPEMRRAFQFKPASFEALRIGCYEANQGWFKRHRDNATRYTAHRSFAMSLNLNTGAYTGGQVQFPEFGRALYEAEAGGAVVFSCGLLHEAMPVTQGRRFAVFTFFADAEGAAREQKMIAEAQAKGQQSGVTLR